MLAKIPWFFRHKCWCSKIWVSAQNHNWKAVSVFIFFTFCRFPGESWSSCLRSLRVGAWPGWTTNRRFKCSRKLTKNNSKRSFHPQAPGLCDPKKVVCCLFVYMFILSQGTSTVRCLFVHMFILSPRARAQCIFYCRSRARGRRDPNVVGQDWRETEDSRGSCKVTIAIIIRCFKDFLFVDICHLSLF